MSELPRNPKNAVSVYRQPSAARAWLLAGHDSEYPPFWREVVQAAIEREGGVANVLALRATDRCNVQSLASAWQARLAAITRAVLAALYPDALPPARAAAENAP